MERLDQHRLYPPLKAMGVVAEAISTLFAADPQTSVREALGDLDELREAVDCLEAYEQFRPDHFDRHEWHGNVYQALQVIQSVEGDLEVPVATRSDGTVRKLLRAMEEFHTYIDNNASFIPNYGERYRHGERISTGFVESTVNQVVSKRMVKKQQMQWTKRGAHLLLQIRTRVLNGEWEATFRTWYPGFRSRIQQVAAWATLR